MARKHEDKWRLFQRADSHPALAESSRIEVLAAMDRVAGKLQLPRPATRRWKRRWATKQIVCRVVRQPL